MSFAQFLKLQIEELRHMATENDEECIQWMLKLTKVGAH